MLIGLLGGHHRLRGGVGEGLGAEARAPRGHAETLGVQVAEELLGQGAEAILKEVYGEAGHP